MSTVPSGGTSVPAAFDADRWREAARVRAGHPGWIVLWLGSLGQYRAYPLVLERHWPIVTAPAADELAALMGQAEQASPVSKR
jgi:hypothetical protein